MLGYCIKVPPPIALSRGSRLTRSGAQPHVCFDPNCFSYMGKQTIPVLRMRVI